MDSSKQLSSSSKGFVKLLTSWGSWVMFSNDWSLVGSLNDKILKSSFPLSKGTLDVTYVFSPLWSHLSLNNILRNRGSSTSQASSEYNSTISLEAYVYPNYLETLHPNTKIHRHIYSHIRLNLLSTRWIFG